MVHDSATFVGALCGPVLPQRQAIVHTYDADDQHGRPRLFFGCEPRGKPAVFVAPGVPVMVPRNTNAVHGRAPVCVTHLGNYAASSRLTGQRAYTLEQQDMIKLLWDLNLDESPVPYPLPMLSLSFAGVFFDDSQRSQQFRDSRISAPDVSVATSECGIFMNLTSRPIEIGVPLVVGAVRCYATSIDGVARPDGALKTCGMINAEYHAAFHEQANTFEPGMFYSRDAICNELHHVYEDSDAALKARIRAALRHIDKVYHYAGHTQQACEPSSLANVMLP